MGKDKWQSYGGDCPGGDQPSDGVTGVQAYKEGEAAARHASDGNGEDGDGHRGEQVYQGILLVPLVQTMDRHALCGHLGPTHGDTQAGGLGHFDEDKDHGAWQEDSALQGVHQQGGLSGGA